MSLIIPVSQTLASVCPDENTLLLIESADSDGATSFTDKSATGHTVTVSGYTQHDTAQKPFGSSSIVFDGSGDYLSVPDSSDWAFGTGPFTIELFTRSGGINDDLLEQGTGGSAGSYAFAMWISGDHYYATVSDGSSGYALTASSNIVDSAWHHVALVRDGNRFDLFVDGASEANRTNAITMNDFASTVKFGTVVGNGAGGLFTGNMTGIRISDVARYPGGTTFSIPTDLFCA